MDIVLGVSMAPRTVRLVAIEGQNADGVTVEQEEFEVGAAGNSVNSAAGAVDQVIDAIIGSREGVFEGGHQLTSTGVTWSDPAGVGALREAIATHELGGVMLVAPLLAAAAAWGDELGPDAVAGDFLGRSGWQRVSETWPDPDLSDPELCFEVADRLASYITVLEPVRNHVGG